MPYFFIYITKENSHAYKLKENQAEAQGGHDAQEYIYEKLTDRKHG